MQLQPLIIAFLLVGLAELGDKTQITVLTLCVKHEAYKIFSGAAIAYLFLTILAVAAGAAIFKLVDPMVIKVLSSLLFIIFGILIIIKKPEDEEGCPKDQKGGFLTAFTLISITEFGDKTQLITIALAAKYKAPVEVFTGALLGLWSITLLSVTLGKTILRFFKNITLLHQLAGVVFILLGLASFFFS